MTSQIVAAFDTASATFFIPEDDDALVAEITRLAGHINAAEYRLIKLVGALIERSAWSPGWDGFKTPAHWLNWACGIDVGAAREKVRVAKCLGDFPLIDEAFRTGTISYSKVRAMTRAATPENEEFLLKIAQYGTASHMERMLGLYRRTQRMRSPEQEKSQYEAREFCWYYDDDGMFVFKGRLMPEDGAALQQALEAVMDLLNQQQKSHGVTGGFSAGHEQMPAEDETFPRKRGEEGDSDADAEEDEEASFSIEDYTGDHPGVFAETWQEEREAPTVAPGRAQNVSAETPIYQPPEITFPQKRADALVLLAETALESLNREGSGGSIADKYQIMLHIEPNRLVLGPEKHQDHQCSLESDNRHFPLSPSVARRLACDAGLVPLLKDEEGNVLNIGRKSRTIPPSIRRALTLRDKGCRYPGCCQTRWVDAHHVKHWCDGGETSLHNLILLCRHHHRLLHQESYRIETEGQGTFRFIKADGTILPPSPYPQFPAAIDATEPLIIEERNATLGLEIDDRTALTLWDGTALDYDMALHALWTRQEETEARLSGSLGHQV